MGTAYVHGYDPKEAQRLQDQAGSLLELLHADTAYPDGSSVLEAGCGVGAQTVTLARNSAGAKITSFDLSETSLTQARQAVATAGLANVTLQQADILNLPFPPASFDHVFVCFVLEHLARPVEALQALKSMLKPGGTITVIEGDHGSTYFHPDSKYASRAVDCLVDLQAAAGGDALIGRRLYPLLTGAGFGEVRVSPRMVYVDDSKPALVDGFTRKTFTAMIEGVHRALKPLLLLGREHEPELGARMRDRVVHLEACHACAGFGIEPLPGGAHVGEVCVGRHGRYHLREQHGVAPRRVLERGIGVPQPVAQRVHAPAVVAIHDLAVLVHVRDVGQRLVAEAVLAKDGGAGLGMQLAIEALGELQLPGVAELLVAEHQHGVFVHAGADDLEGCGVVDFAQVHPVYGGGETGMQLVENEGHVE